MLTIGVTGGIGSGKSTVIKILGEFGATLIDADKATPFRCTSRAAPPTTGGRSIR